MGRTRPVNPDTESLISTVYRERTTPVMTSPLRTLFRYSEKTIDGT